MAERSTVTQVAQIGLETTPGTSVAATKVLAAVDLATEPQFTIMPFRPAGYKVNTVHATEREWVEIGLRGQPTYTEMIYLLASLLTTPSAPTTILDGATDTLARRWTFTPGSTAPDTPQTFTIEQGSSVRAHKITYGLVTEMGMNFSRERIEISGRMIGQRITDGITLTPSLSQLELVPITASDICVYIDSTSGALGTTKLGRLFTGNPQVGSRYNPVWAVDCAQPSFSAHVETPNESRMSMMVEADAAGMAYLTDARNNDTLFMRIKATGPTIYVPTSVPYSFQWDMAIQVRDVTSFSDHEGVYAIGYEFDIVHDPTWNKHQQIQVVNKLSSM